jgi:hypothetical protein
MRANSDMLIRVLALTAGLAVSAVALFALRVPPSQRVVGTDVAFEAVKPGELRLDPSGRFGFTRDLRPGGPPTRATVRVSNDADLPLAVSVAARPGKGEASRALRFRVSPSRFALARRGRRRVRVTAWLPRSDGPELRARLGTVQLKLRGRTR